MRSPLKFSCFILQRRKKNTLVKIVRINRSFFNSVSDPHQDDADPTF